jgi:hypothetical protein
MNTTHEFLFSFLSYIPGPFWLLILFIPKNKKAMLAVDIFLLVMSLLFVIQTVPVLSEILAIIFKPTFPEMKAFLSSDAGFLGSWNHMILSDVWIGRWVAYDSLQFEKSWLIRGIIIPIILIVGPFGLFFYLLFRIIKKRSFAFSQLA